MAYALGVVPYVGVDAHNECKCCSETCEYCNKRVYSIQVRASESAFFLPSGVVLGASSLEHIRLFVHFRCQ